MLSSPTISHNDEEQSGANVAANEEKQDTDEGEEDKKADEEQEEIIEDPAEKVEEFGKPVVHAPLKILYQNRDLLDLSENILGSEQFVQYTVLPENNVNCFFQNRAQYWRLSSSEWQEYSLEKCSCCDFTYPSTQQVNQGTPLMKNKNVSINAVTDSLLAFLKSNTDSTSATPNNASKRLLSHNTQFVGGYQVSQPSSQQYQPPVNGFYGGSSNFTNNYNQPVNPFMSNGGGYGTTLALLNLMNNASRNASNAFQAMSNTPRYYNNINNMNNGCGLYKQF